MIKYNLFDGLESFIGLEEVAQLTHTEDLDINFLNEIVIVVSQLDFREYYHLINGVIYSKFNLYLSENEEGFGINVYTKYNDRDIRITFHNINNILDYKYYDYI